MSFETFIPLLPLFVGFLVRFFLEEEWRTEVEKALFTSVLLFAIILGLNFPALLFYSSLIILASLETKTIFSSIFGVIITLFSYLVANPLFSIIPLALTGIAEPLAQFINRFSHRTSRGVGWAIFMSAFSITIASFLFVSLGPINPLWGILIGLIATWASYVDTRYDSAYVLIAMGFIYGAPSAIVMGFGVSLISSSLAYYLKSLDFNGLVGGVIIGTLIFGASPILFFVMFAFLVSSSILSKTAKHKDNRFHQKGKRNAIQVLANGFGLSLASLLILSGVDALGMGIAAAAASTADTWATELGSRSKRKPRLLTNFKFVEKGRSGGITPKGLMASLLGGSFIFILTLPFYGFLYLAHGLVGGALGSLFDSLMGATCQGLNKCRICNKLTETEIHCGKDTLLEKGLRWMNNDMVNLLSSLIAMAVFI